MLERVLLGIFITVGVVAYCLIPVWIALLLNCMRKMQKRRKRILCTDKDNIFPVGVTDAEFRQFCIEYLLGENWYVTDPFGQEQVNEIALDEILARYSRQYRKEYRKHK